MSLKILYVRGSGQHYLMMILMVKHSRIEDHSKMRFYGPYMQQMQLHLHRADLE